MTAGQKIQAARKASGLTQKQLGEILGVTASMIGQYETGFRNPKESTLIRIAEALGIHPVDLMDLESMTVKRLRLMYDDIQTQLYQAKLQLDDYDGKPEDESISALNSHIHIIESAREDVRSALKEKLMQDTGNFFGSKELDDYRREQWKFVADHQPLFNLMRKAGITVGGNEHEGISLNHGNDEAEMVKQTIVSLEERVVDMIKSYAEKEWGFDCFIPDSDDNLEEAVNKLTGISEDADSAEGDAGGQKSSPAGL